MALAFGNVQCLNREVFVGQVHGDVFRAPMASSLLAVHVGTGVQLISMAVVTMMFAVLGFLSPANRGGLMTAVLLLFVFMGVFAGYSSARLYKTFKVGLQGWPRCKGLAGVCPLKRLCLRLGRTI